MHYFSKPLTLSIEPPRQLLNHYIQKYLSLCFLTNLLISIFSSPSIVNKGSCDIVNSNRGKMRVVSLNIQENFNDSSPFTVIKCSDEVWVMRI